MSLRLLSEAQFAQPLLLRCASSVCVCASQRAFCQRMAAGGRFDIRGLGCGRKPEPADAERINSETIMMRRVSLGRAGAVVSRLAEVVDRLRDD